MAGSPDSIDPADFEETIPRFALGSRLVHWIHAVPFLFLLVSGLTLFVPPLKAIHLGGYRLVPLAHVVVGIAFILSPLPLYAVLPDRPRVKDDLRRLCHFDRGDPGWARYAFNLALGMRAQRPPQGKFSLGQKLNSAFTASVTLGLMVTGAVLAVNFFSKSVFAARFVEQVFPLHDAMMVVALPVVAAHIYLGSLNPGTRESLRGITGGSVRLSWARAHHAGWVEEMKSRR
jgi:formate dehydrogenase subunit gamma